MGDADPGFGDPLLDFGGAGVDRLGVVVEVVGLAAPAELLPEGFDDDAGVMLQNVGLDWVAVLGRLFQHAHVPDAAHRHIQRPGDRGSRQGQHVDRGEHLLKPLLVGDAEPLLLVDNREAEVFKVDVFADKPVGADDNVDEPPLQLRHNLLLLLRGAEAGEQLDRHRVVAHPGGDRLVMLPGEDGRRAEDCALFAVQHALKGRPERHLGLAETDVAAEQPLHRHRLFHILFNLPDAPQLVVGLLVLEMLLKVPLHLVVGREGVPFDRHPLGVEGNQFVRHLVDRLLDPLAGLLPLGRVEAVELDVGVLPGADVFGYKVQLGDRDVEDVAPGVFDLDIVLDDPLQFQLVDAVEDADAVGHMDDVVARRQVGKRPDFLPLPLFRLFGGEGVGAGGGGQREPDFRVFKPGREGPGEDDHPPVADGL